MKRGNNNINNMLHIILKEHINNIGNKIKYDILFYHLQVMEIFVHFLLHIFVNVTMFYLLLSKG